MTIPQAVADLIDRFTRNLDTYKSPDYNEAQLRLEFLNPLFQALGWDMANAAGYADAYKDVIHEDSLKIGGLAGASGGGGGTKAPDYCFRIGGTRKFFLEAKKPSIDVKGDPSPAYQLRRYAWSAKLPISVLSDFEEFAIYDSRIKPARSDKASAARIFYCTYDQFPEKWDQIAAILSKDAVLKGSFDRYAQSARGKRGTAEVDDAFLAEIEKWRDQLAANVALRNPNLSERDLNFAVTKTIDRIVFLRICEDRGVEIYAQLQTIAKTNDIYGELLKLFRRADEKYNSGLFHFTKEPDRLEDPDTLSPSLDIDDKVLRPILESLYYPDCPYEFSVLPSDILGHVYEQFLGKVIRLTPGHRAKVEEKPEVRKAGGVYYTPTYIVAYIIENTLGKLLGDPTSGADAPVGSSPMSTATVRERQPTSLQVGTPPAQATNDSPPTKSLAPKDAAKLKILDPACGSGSFLLGAYQYLLEWHLQYYASHNPDQFLKQRQPPIYQIPSSPPTADHSSLTTAYRLTTSEKKRILLNNIFGVDIDQNAVETTKLSLLLKVLENESSESLANQFKLFRERALPDLANNIKCGNSLVARDFYENGQLSLLDDEQTLFKINAFDWGVEFRPITASGGFDAVIGNPPYIRMESFKELKRYLESHYKVHGARTDLYAYFVEQSHNLLKPGGRFGMILSNKFIKAGYGLPLRNFLLEHSAIERLTDFAGLPVFLGATVRTIIVITRRLEPPKLPETYYTPPVKFADFAEIVAKTKSVQEVIGSNSFNLPPGALGADTWLLLDSATASLLRKLRNNSTSLGDLVQNRILWGIKTGLNEAFVIDAPTRRSIVKADRRSAEIIKPYLFGEEVRRYSVVEPSLFLIYTYHDVDIKQYPGIEQHLRPFKSRLQKRATDQEWYELQQPSVALIPVFEHPKIIYPEIAPECRFSIDTKGYYGNNKTFILPTSDRLLLGLLNSRVALFYFTAYCAALEGKKGKYLEFRAQYVKGFPIPAEKSTEQKRRMTSFVDAMLALHEQLAKSKTGREQIQRQIDATDRQIDALVYELYQLTPEEIQLVESATATPQ